MAEWPKRQIGVVFVLISGFAAWIAFQFVRSGKAAEQDFVIVGQPQSSVAAPSDGVALSGSHSKIHAAPVPAVNVAPQPPAKFVVHVAGAVKKPGVYRLDPESRVEDAIRTAGGQTPDADVDAINLAGRVEDGSRLYLPTHKETASGAPTYSEVKNATGGKGGKNGGKFTQPGKESVNINSANAEQLQRLPGVGPAMAAKILQHRKEVGRFAEPDQLMDVSGIGEKKLAKMKPFVRVR